MLSHQLLVWYMIFTLLFYSEQAAASECSPCFFHGKDTRIQEFPYHAALARCGAAILSDKWLITAANCAEMRTPANKVWVGGQSISDSQQITYKKAIIHPRYRNMHNIPINNIALLELNKKLTFSDKIKPIQISGHNDGKNLVFIGRGNDETGRPSTSIKKLDLKRLTTAQCLEEMPPHIRQIVKRHIKNLEKNNICTKTEDAPGLCMGDFGSPVTYNNQLVGLASYIANTDCHTRLNILTDVASYAHWIKSVTGLD